MPRVNLAVLALGLSVALGAAPAAAGDAARGEKLFKKCQACHTIEKGAGNKVGPNLWGVVGREAGEAEGYRYSRAMQKADLTWDEATLDEWLTKPSNLVKGTKMTFPGLKKPQEREDVISFLKTQSD